MQEIVGQIVRLPIESTADAALWGNVGSVLYRDTIDGVRFTAHHAVGDGYWIVQHGPHTGDSDGPAIARSVLWYSAEALNRNWSAVRTGRAEST